METIPESKTVYAIYNIKSKVIRYPVFEALEDAKKELELVVIRFFNDEIAGIDHALKEKLRSLNRKPTTKKPVSLKNVKIVRKSDSESESESEDESDVSSENEDSSSEDESEDEYANMDKEQLHKELRSTMERFKHQHDVLNETRMNFKIVSFSICE